MSISDAGWDSCLPGKDHALRERPVAVAGRNGGYIVDPDFEVGKRQRVIDADSRDVWLENCRHGSAWVTLVDLKFQHIMADDEKDPLAPSPAHAVIIAVDAHRRCVR